MYSVIQPIEVLDNNNIMVSTWIVLATDLDSLEDGNQYITDNVEKESVEFTWVIKTSHILAFPPEKLQYIILGFEESEDRYSVTGFAGP